MFFVHEEFPSHEKWEPLDDDPVTWANCVAVWLWAGCYCRLRLSDGHISRSKLERLTPLGAKATKYADVLVELQLWERTEDGYQFHDWDHVQETKEEVQRRRLKWRLKKTKKGSPSVDSGEASPGEQHGDSQHPRDGKGRVGSESDPEPESGVAARPETSRETKDLAPRRRSTASDRMAAHFSRGEPGFNRDELETLFSEARRAAKLGSYELQHTDDIWADAAVRWAKRDHADNPGAACLRSMANYFAHCETDNGKKSFEAWTFKGWAKDPAKWFAQDANPAGTAKPLAHRLLPVPPTEHTG